MSGDCERLHRGLSSCPVKTLRGSVAATGQTSDSAHRIESELKRLVKTLAVGNRSPTVMAAITEREARIRDITNQVIEPGKGSLEEKLDEFADLRRRASDQSARAAGESSRSSRSESIAGRADWKVHAGTSCRRREVSFKASGQIDFFGEEALTRMDGAGGPVATERHIPFTIKVAA